MVYVTVMSVAKLLLSLSEVEAEQAYHGSLLARALGKKQAKVQARMSAPVARRQAKRKVGKPKKSKAE